MNKKPPFRYYVVLADTPWKHRRAKVVKSREPVAGAVFSHDHREHALDFQKTHNKKLASLRRGIERKITKAHALLMRVAPAFKGFVVKNVVAGAEQESALIKEGRLPNESRESCSSGGL